LDALVTQILSDHDEASLTGALDRLSGADPVAYGALIETIENCSETVVERAGSSMRVMLFALPILAWSRFPIPSGTLSTELLATVRAQVHGHILARDARFSLINHLFSPDHLPQSYSETRTLTQRITASALHGRDFAIDATTFPDTATFLSDTRYLLGAVAIEEGSALYRWQEDGIAPEVAYQHLEVQLQDAIRGLLPACAFQLQPPTTYHTALRDSDRSSRPYSVLASIEFLKTVMDCQASALQASVGCYFGKQLEEYRIGFALSESNDILHGVVWPVLDPEDERAEALQQIEAMLKAQGVGIVKLQSHRFPVEFCDDCGAPLFPNADGDSTHAELPDEINDAQPQRLH
jgi:hypothetical protein